MSDPWKSGRRDWIRGTGAGVLTAALGCGGTEPEPSDGGGADAGNVDANTQFDSGRPDAGRPDAEARDVGGPDTGPTFDGPPSFVFIMVDDLNDFPSPFGGYPGEVRTPNFERLGRMGVRFQRAYCASPVCGGSRLATMSGMAPYRTGRWGNEATLALDESDFPPGLFAQLTWLQKAVRDGNTPTREPFYRTYQSGKIFHNSGAVGFDCGSEAHSLDLETCETIYAPEYDELCGAGNFGQDDFLDGHYSPPLRVSENSPYYAQQGPSMHCWPRPAYDDGEDLPDQAIARWGASLLDGELPLDERFFLALGFYRPHAPWHVPTRYFDLYPADSIQVPSFMREQQDRHDLTVLGCRAMRTERLKDAEGNILTGAAWETAMRQILRAYLASVSFVDEQLGVVLDAVERRRAQGDRVVVVLLSDHGYFLGEKLGTQKQKLFEPAARAPLIISDPLGAQDVDCERVVSLLDVYPTVLEIAGIRPTGPLDGESLVPLVRDPQAPRDRPAITSFSYAAYVDAGSEVAAGCAAGDPSTARDDVTRTPITPPRPSPADPRAGMSFSIRNERYRYHWYALEGLFEGPGGAAPLHEELYDLDDDPDERVNLLHPTVLTPAARTIADRLHRELMSRVAV